MREILFRGKRADNGEWIQGDLLQNVDCLKIREQEKDIKHIARSFVIFPETVGQYTGLSDKNGIKIFEGDIVRIYLFGGVEIGQITYSEISCRFKFADKYGSTYGFDDTCTFEVIGNIYDTPELLKGGAKMDGGGE